MTDKLIADYSNSNLFVYNGLSNEKDYAVKMLNKNKNPIHETILDVSGIENDIKVEVAF